MGGWTQGFLFTFCASKRQPDIADNSAVLLQRHPGSSLPFPHQVCSVGVPACSVTRHWFDGTMKNLIYSCYLFLFASSVTNFCCLPCIVRLHVVVYIVVYIVYVVVDIHSVLPGRKPQQSVKRWISVEVKCCFGLTGTGRMLSFLVTYNDEKC